MNISIDIGLYNDDIIGPAIKSPTLKHHQATYG